MGIKLLKLQRRKNTFEQSLGIANDTSGVPQQATELVEWYCTFFPLQ